MQAPCCVDEGEYFGNEIWWYADSELAHGNSEAQDLVDWVMKSITGEVVDPCVSKKAVGGGVHW